MPDQAEQAVDTYAATQVNNQLAIIVQGEAWDRQQGESPKQFQHFSMFRLLGPTRTIAEFCRQSDLDYTYIRGLSSEHHWYARAEAWDRFNDTVYAVKMAEERKRVVTRHLDLAEEFLDKVTARLKRLDVKKLNPDQLARWLDVATKVQRSALGFHEDGQQQPGHPSVVVNLHQQIDNRQQTLDVTEKTMERMDVFRKLASAHESIQQAIPDDAKDVTPADADGTAA